jgi:hypothetical protein
MMYVALAALGVAALAIACFAPILRYIVRQSARDRELLVNQVCALAGRPWQEPPSWEPPVLALAEEETYSTPEQVTAY